MLIAFVDIIQLRGLGRSEWKDNDLRGADVDDEFRGSYH